MKNKVLKFGGTSLATAESIKKVEKIIKNTKNLKSVVVSAPGKSEKYKIKVTDALLLAYLNPDKYDYYINYVKSVFSDIIKGLEIYFDLAREFEVINRHFKKYKTKSYLLSRGEYIIAKILSIYLNIKFVDSKNVIKFANNGKILQKTYKNLKKEIRKYETVIIPGFYGSNRFGKIKIMCRGGSDITGSIVANSLKNAEYYNYTDVDGIYNFSPKLNMKSQVIKKISYDDIKFLSFFGAGVLHYKCSGVFNQGRTIIKNTFNNKSFGSVITNKKVSIKKAITSTQGYQITFNEKNKIILKLFKKLKHEKLYKFSCMGYCYYGYRVDLRENQNKILEKLYKNADNLNEIVVYGIIGDLKNMNLINLKKKSQILYFSVNNKTNIVCIKDK